ncbi:transcriptional regulator UhpA [Parasalinivibrio latis]|uniref:transcriptional regulator UhpA n=1 Tax=Parasalinivibrio latis TaxID=2952610 RepID=UPI0030E0194F
MIHVALVDDHLVVRSGFAFLLGLEEDITVVGEYSSAEEARRGLPGCQAEVVILDISMPDESGLSLLESLPKGLACIMLSVHDASSVIEKALAAGAKGFLSKRCSPEELVQAVRVAAAGGCYLTTDIARKLATPSLDLQKLNQLTRREREVAEWLAKGLDVKSVAAELGLSPKTVHVHRANAMDKLGVSNNVELANCFRDEAV